MRLYRILSIVIGIGAVTLLSSCTTLMQQFTDQGMRRGVSSSLVEYLYPKGETPPDFKEEPP